MAVNFFFEGQPILISLSLFYSQQGEEEASQGDKAGLDWAQGQLHAAQSVQADGPGGPGQL